MDIKEREQNINDFLTNPFLVALLYKSYTYNKDIPTKRVTFYEEVYTALYKAHDVSKDGFKRQKRSKLDFQDFRIVLRDLAFSTAKLKEVEYTEPVLLKYIKESKDNCMGIVFNESNFLDDLLLTVPLLIRDGNKIKWAHKSIQDYFAAEFVCFHNKEEEILDKVYKSQNEAFLNILALIQELDNKTFRKNILLKILEDFVEYYHSSYKDFEVNDSILSRKVLSYGVKMCFLKTNKLIDSNEVLRIVKEKFPGLKNENFYCNIIYDNNFYIVSSINFNRELLEILYPNLKHLFVEKLDDEFPRKERDMCRVENEPEFVDDSLNNYLNRSENFDATNFWFMDRIRNRRLTTDWAVMALDFEKCNQENDLIKEEIEKENSLDILDGI